MFCEAALAEPIPVFVSIPPQKYFLERVGGQRVQVSVMVGPGQSPATYEPTPKQMSQLADARIFFRMGSPFEQVWMQRIKAANPTMRIVDARNGIPLRTLQPAGGSSSKAMGRKVEKDPHIWTSPPLVKRMAAHSKDALGELDPEHRGEYERNYRRFAEDLDRLDREIRNMLDGVKVRRFMVFHPSWGYYADTYGLEQIPIESEGKQPGPKTLARLIDLARHDGIKVIFVQKQFSRRNAEAVARAIGGKVVAVDPLAENYLENLRNVAKIFAEAMP